MRPPRERGRSSSSTANPGGAPNYGSVVDTEQNQQQQVPYGGNGNDNGAVHHNASYTDVHSPVSDGAGASSPRETALHASLASIAASIQNLNSSDNMMMNNSGNLTGTANNNNNNHNVGDPDDMQNGSGGDLVSPTEEQRSIYRLEQVLRYMLILLIVILLGIFHPRWFPVFAQITIWCLVAWTTCLILIGMTIWQNPRRSSVADENDGIMRDGSSAGDAVYQLEKILRMALVVLVVFLIAIFHPYYALLVSRVALWVAIAWITCFILIVMTVCQQSWQKDVDDDDDEDDAGIENMEDEGDIEEGRQSRRMLSENDLRYSHGNDGNGDDDDDDDDDDLVSRSITIMDDLTEASKRDMVLVKPDSEEGLGIETSIVDKMIEPTTIQPVNPTGDDDNTITNKTMDKETKADNKTDDKFSKNDDDGSKNETEEEEEAPLPHPDLDPLLVVDGPSSRRLVPNTGRFRLDNDLFSGDMVFMIRTPDVDNPKARKGTPMNDSYVEYFRGKQRRFEMQFQLKLKRIPQGKVYFACELDEPVKMGVLQKAFVGASMAFVKKMSAKDSFHYSISGQKPEPNGRYEKPHMSFTVDGSMDRIVVTKPGEEPPQLEDVIHEEPDSVKRRKKGESIEWNTNDTYTMALWSAYFDFLDWRCINLPGIRPFSLSSVVGPQHINLTLYDMPNYKTVDKHYRCELINAVAIEIGHRTETNQGSGTTKYLADSQKKKMRKKKQQQEQQRKMKEKNAQAKAKRELEESKRDPDKESTPTQAVVTPGPTNEEVSAVDTKEDDVLLVEDLDRCEDEEGNAEVPEGIIDAVKDIECGLYLRTHEPVAVQLYPPASDSAHGAMTQVGGFAIAQQSCLASVVFDKVTEGKRRGSKTKRSNKTPTPLKSGDVVSVKLVSADGQDAVDESDVKHLVVHRGWWLKWTTIPSKKNGTFTIRAVAHSEDADVPNAASGTNGSSTIPNDPIHLGDPFVMCHNQKDEYHVGISTDDSPTYGGRILGLYSGGGTIVPRRDRLLSEDDDKHSRSSSVEEEAAIVSPSKEDSQWLEPVVFAANLPTVETWTPPSSPVNSKRLPSSMSSITLADEDGTLQRPVEQKDITDHFDLPIWVEMMDRTERRPQVAFVVRSVLVEQDDAATDPKTMPFMRLRTGREVADLMKIGTAAGRRIAQKAIRKNKTASEQKNE